MRLILVRSAGTAWHAGAPTEDESRIQGTVPLPLSEEGMAVLRDVAEKVRQLGPACLVSSGNESSGTTAAYLADLCGIKAKKLAELRELDCGVWQGLRVGEIKERFGRAYKQWRQDPTSVRPPQGEALEAAAVRVERALEQIRKKHKGKTVVIVAAYIVAGLVECLITGRPLGELWAAAEGAGNIRVLELADTAPLEGGGRVIEQIVAKQGG